MHDGCRCCSEFTAANQKIKSLFSAVTIHPGAASARAAFSLHALLCGHGVAANARSAQTIRMEPFDPDDLTDEPTQDERSHLEGLARALGITYDELSELELEIVEDTDEEGHVISMTVFFEEGNPPEIMAKIAGVVDGQVELTGGF